MHVITNGHRQRNIFFSHTYLLNGIERSLIEVFRENEGDEEGEKKEEERIIKKNQQQQNYNKHTKPQSLRINILKAEK